MKKRLSVTLKGSFLSLAITLMLSLLLSALVFYGDIPDKAVTAVIFFISAISCMSGSYSAAKVLGSKGLLTGALLGFFYYIALFILSAFLRRSLSIDSNMLIMLLSAALSGMLGGVLAMPR